MPECLHDLEDDRVAQHRVGHIEISFDHHPLGKIARRQLAIAPELLHANVGDLSFLEEAMADYVSRALTVRLAEQSD
jgi:hypothetical protein